MAIAGDIGIAVAKFFVAAVTGSSAMLSEGVHSLVDTGNELRHLLTMRLGPDSVLLTAAVRFQRRLNLDQVEQAIDRLEHTIKASYPSILHLYLESGAFRQR